MVELETGPVAAGGACVARLEGRVVFVRHTLPGERVLARVTEQRRGYWRADAVSVLRAAAERVAPPCPAAGPGGCGGCDWQHVDPARQRADKAALVSEQLRRLAGLDLAVQVAELPGGALGWRSRTRFAVGRGGRAGLHPHRSHDVVALADCPLLTCEARAVGVLGQRWSGAAAVEVVASASGGGRAVVVSPHARRSVPVPELPADVAVLAATGAGEHQVLRGGQAVVETVDGWDYQVSGSGFWQVHPAAPAVLLGAVLDALGELAGRRVLDLYSGAGLFAAALARRGAVVDAVEHDRAAARDARHNCAGLTVTVHHGDVGAVLAGLAPTPLAVLDPPRTGCAVGVCELLTERVGERIAYLSCDPATLARDLARLRALGWRVRSVAGFDAFPMTAHVECLALLERARPVASSAAAGRGRLGV